MDLASVERNGLWREARTTLSGPLRSTGVKPVAPLRVLFPITALPKHRYTGALNHRPTTVPPLRRSSNCGNILRMNLPISAEIHRDGDWYVAFCPEVPEANGQGHTEEECLESLRQAILLLMEDRREDAKSRLKDEATLLELA